MGLQRNFLDGNTINTIYFGGGTPSMLTTMAIAQIIEAIHRTFPVSPDAEITLEANPDDLDQQKLSTLKNVGINRLSMGIQSFFETDLKYLNRTHSPEHSEKIIRLARDAGFLNLSIDLIFGIPTLTTERWLANIKHAINLEVPHISAYSLTVEPHTALDVMIRKGKFAEPSDDTSAHHFTMLMETMTKHGYIHYEISNFSLPGFESQHNSNYWNGETYLGLGPSAHSYNGTERRWNINNLSKWTTKTASGESCYESEILTVPQKHNEYVMTALRTNKGCELRKLSRLAGEEAATSFINKAKRYLDSGDMTLDNGIYTLTNRGKLLADGISAYLFADSGDDAL